MGVHEMGEQHQTGNPGGPTLSAHPSPPLGLGMNPNPYMGMNPALDDDDDNDDDDDESFSFSLANTCSLINLATVSAILFRPALGTAAL